MNIQYIRKQVLYMKIKKIISLFTAVAVLTSCISFANASEEADGVEGEGEDIVAEDDSAFIENKNHC